MLHERLLKKYAFCGCGDGEDDTEPETKPPSK